MNRRRYCPTGGSDTKAVLWSAAPAGERASQALQARTAASAVAPSWRRLMAEDQGCGARGEVPMPPTPALLPRRRRGSFGVWVPNMVEVGCIGLPLIECQGRRAVQRFKVACPPFAICITPPKAQPTERLSLSTRRTAAAPPGRTKRRHKSARRRRRSPWQPRDVAVRRDGKGEGRWGLDGPTLSVAAPGKRQERS